MVIMIRVAVTGGIACGKSLAASVMKAAGVPVCEADSVAHALMMPGNAVYNTVVDAFGSRILAEDGTINRSVLGEVVFNEAVARHRLNALVHPSVRTAIAGWLSQQEKAGEAMAVAVIPLLFEAEMAGDWNTVICVACQPSVQRERLGSRGLSETECRMRIEAQMPLAEKIERSDYTIWNDGDESMLSEAVRQVMNSIEERYT